MLSVTYERAYGFRFFKDNIAGGVTSTPRSAGFFTSNGVFFAFMMLGRLS
jgi:hypothetical protein